jgi:hypothetical protein
MSTELQAAYERIEELEQVLRQARGYINRDPDSDDLAECLDAIDDALAEKTVLA